MELKTQIKNLSYLGSTKLFQLVVQILRAKLNAIFIGVTGVGIFNQLNSFTAKTAQFSQLSVNEALVKQIAENKEDSSSYLHIYSSLKAYLYIVFGITILVFATLLIYNTQVANYLLGNSPNMSYYFIAISAFPIILFNSVFFASTMM